MPIMRVPMLGCDWRGGRAPVSPLQPVLKHGGSLMRKGKKPHAQVNMLPSVLLSGRAVRWMIAA